MEQDEIAEAAVVAEADPVRRLAGDFGGAAGGCGFSGRRSLCGDQASECDER